MGNQSSIAKDFHHVRLSGKHDMPSVRKEQQLLTSCSVAKRPQTILLRKDPHRKSTIYFDVLTMKPVFLGLTTKTRKGDVIHKTKDASGRTLFLTTSPNKNLKLIYRTPEDLSNNTLDGNSGHSAHSADFSLSSTVTKSYDTDVPCAAQIEIDRTGSSVTAFLSVCVWTGTGPKFVPVYKAVKIPQVKHGVLITDMDGQAVVGKTSMDEDRMEPKIKVAAGADVAGVLALASSLLGEM